MPGGLGDRIGVPIPQAWTPARGSEWGEDVERTLIGSAFGGGRRAGIDLTGLDDRRRGVILDGWRLAATPDNCTERKHRGEQSACSEERTHGDPFTKELHEARPDRIPRRMSRSGMRSPRTMRWLGPHPKIQGGFPPDPLGGSPSCRFPVESAKMCNTRHDQGRTRRWVVSAPVSCGTSAMIRLGI